MNLTNACRGGLLGAVIAAWLLAVGVAASADEPSHQVIACYFHRTIRCPTCQKVGQYVEEAVRDGFVQQAKQGAVVVRMIDFQDARNKAYVDYYKITGPTLLVMDVRDGKVAQWKAASKVWSLVNKKDALLKYVQDEIAAYRPAR